MAAPPMPGEPAKAAVFALAYEIARGGRRAAPISPLTDYYFALKITLQSSHLTNDRE
jgi:hypothetical protein